MAVTETELHWHEPGEEELLSLFFAQKGDVEGVSIVVADNTKEISVFVPARDLVRVVGFLARFMK